MEAVPHPRQSLLRLGTGLGATLLGSAWLVCLPAHAQLVPTTGLRSLGTSLRMNGQVAPGCSAGLCQVEGGTSRGTNLFHRFAQFDTRSGITPGITRVDFLNGLQRAVIVGVTSPGGSFITVPVTGQNGAGLFFLSPGGISISGGGGFTGWGDLLLTTKTNLAFGTSLFNAYTTLPDNNPDWSTAPVLSSSSLSTDPTNIANNGPISLLAGSLISIDRNLLIDSGNNDLTLQNASILAGLAGTPGIGETSNGGASLKGRTINATNSRITALRTGLEATDITLTGTTIQAPRGLIDVYAANSIKLDGSTLSLAPLKVEDLYGPGLFGYELVIGGSTTRENPPGTIRLATANATGSGIEILNKSSINASIELQGQSAFANFDQARARTFAGNISVASASQLTVDGSTISANATDGAAGAIALFNLNPSGNLRINNSTMITANSPLGSGDIDLSGAGGVNILANSRLEAYSKGAPDSALTFSPAGQIFIINSSPTAPLLIQDSQILASYETSVLFPPNFNQALALVDELDPADTPNSSSPSPLIRLTSAGGTQLSNAVLDAGSGSGFAGKIDIRNGAGGLQVLGSQLLAVLSAPPTDPALDGKGVTGSIDLYSQSGISIDAASTLNVSSAYGGFQAGAAPKLQLINDSTTTPLTVTDSSLLARAGVGALGSDVFLGSKGGITLDKATIDASGGIGGTLTVASTGDSTTQFSISPDSFLTNLGDGGGSPPLPILLTYLDTTTVPNYIDATYFSTFNNTHPLVYPATSPGDLQGELSYKFTTTGEGFFLYNFISSPVWNQVSDPPSLQALDERVNAGSANYSEQILQTRQNFLLNKLNVTARQPETDRIITVNDGIVTITEITQSFQVLGGGTTTTNPISFNLSNAADAAALQALLGDGLFNAVVNQTPLAPTNTNPSSGAVVSPQTGPGNTSQPSITTSPLLASGTREGPSQGTESASKNAGAATGTPSLSVKSAENLDPKKALASLDQGELTSLQAVSQALGLGTTPASPPSISQLQGFMRAAIEAIRQRQKGLAWNQDGGQAQAIATVDTSNLLLAKASFDQASYKPAILRYSFTPKPAGAAGTADAAKAPPTGLIDIVLVLPDGEPQGWRVEVPIARLREALARHYANMAGMGPLPGGNPAATPAASQLAQLLLEPVQPTLKANGITSLIISSDLNLIDVPYASLPLGGGYLAG